MTRQRTRSTAQTVGTLLLVVVVLRLGLDPLDLTCKAIAWLLLRVCWALEWAVDQLSTRETVRPSGVVTMRASLPPSGTTVVRAPIARPNPRLDDYPYKGSRSMQLPIAAARSADDVAKLCKVLGRNDPETRRLAEAMLASSTRVQVT